MNSPSKLEPRSPAAFFPETAGVVRSGHRFRSLAILFASVFASALPSSARALGPGEAEQPRSSAATSETCEQDCDGEVSTERDSDTMRATSTTTVLDARRIRLSGATSIPELLRSVPGVQVVRHSNGNYLVSMRGAGGLAGNNVLVTLDGIPLNNFADGSIDWDLLPLDVRDVERVEVVRGPASPSHGGGAYAGAINIVRRRSTNDRHAAAVRGVGGVDLHPAALGIGGARYIYSGERARFEWFATGRRDDTANRGSGAVHPPALQVGSLAALTVTTGERSQLVVELAGALSRRGSLGLLVPVSLPTVRATGLGRIAWRASELPGVLDTVEVWTRARARFIRADVTAFPGVGEVHTDAVRPELGLGLGFDFHPKVRGRIGAEGALTWIDAPYVRSTASGGPRPGVGFDAGLSLFPTETFDIDVRTRAQVTGRPAMSCRLSLVYHRARWALRVAASSDYRSPTPLETAGQIIDPLTGLVMLEGNPQLELPRYHSIELGSTIAPIPKLAIRPVVYVSAITHAVVADFEPPVAKTFGSDPSPRWLVGGELELDWDIIDQLALRSSGGYLQFVDFDPTLAPTTGAPEQSSRWMAALRLYGSTTDERVGYGLGGELISSRSYSTRVGIPTVALDVELPHSGYVDARVEVQPSRRAPVWLSASGRAGLLPGTVESPLPGAAQMNVVFMLGLEWRRE